MDDGAPSSARLRSHASFMGGRAPQKVSPLMHVLVSNYSDAERAMEALREDCDPVCCVRRNSTSTHRRFTHFAGRAGHLLPVKVH